MVAAQNVDIPVINAGDGGHNHPTQTLTDLLTIQRRKGRLTDLTIGLCGDLKFGRTVHSLIKSLSRYPGIRFVLISPEELRVPEYVISEAITSVRACAAPLSADWKQKIDADYRRRGGKTRRDGRF